MSDIWAAAPGRSLDDSTVSSPRADGATSSHSTSPCTAPAAASAASQSPRIGVALGGCGSGSGEIGRDPQGSAPSRKAECGTRTRNSEVGRLRFAVTEAAAAATASAAAVAGAAVTSAAANLSGRGGSNTLFESAPAAVQESDTAKVEGRVGPVASGTGLAGLPQQLAEVHGRLRELADEVRLQTGLAESSCDEDDAGEEADAEAAVPAWLPQAQPCQAPGGSQGLPMDASAESAHLGIHVEELRADMGRVVADLRGTQARLELLEGKVAELWARVDFQLQTPLQLQQQQQQRQQSPTTLPVSDWSAALAAQVRADAQQQLSALTAHIRAEADEQLSAITCQVDEQLGELGAQCHKQLHESTQLMRTQLADHAVEVERMLQRAQGEPSSGSKVAAALTPPAKQSWALPSSPRCQAAASEPIAAPAASKPCSQPAQPHHGKALAAALGTSAAGKQPRAPSAVFGSRNWEGPELPQPMIEEEIIEVPPKARRPATIAAPGTAMRDRSLQLAADAAAVALAAEPLVAASSAYAYRGGSPAASSVSTPRASEFVAQLREALPLQPPRLRP